MCVCVCVCVLFFWSGVCCKTMHFNSEMASSTYNSGHRLLTFVMQFETNCTNAVHFAGVQRLLFISFVIQFLMFHIPTDTSLVKNLPISVVRAIAHGAMGHRIGPSW